MIPVVCIVFAYGYWKGVWYYRFGSMLVRWGIVHRVLNSIYLVL